MYYKEVSKKNKKIKLKGEKLFMRAYGRMMKNIAGLLLLLALISLLLPFCKFNAGAGETTLSGIEVVKAGGKAGYTYFKTGGVPDDFVLKSPYTWGSLRESVSYINEAGGGRILILCTLAVVVPILLCFFAMIMLFMAEGKKTMFLPTLFTFSVSAEMLFVILFITQLKPFLMIGVYLFTILNIIALIFIMLGWITGGYRQPDRRRGRYGGENDRDDGGNDNSRRKRTRRKTRHKKKTKKKRDKSSDNKKKDNNEDKEKKNEQENMSGEPITGIINGGSGIYHGLSWNLKNGNSRTVTIGTTSDAMDALEAKSIKNIESIAGNNCKISYDMNEGKYLIESHSQIQLLLVRNGQVVKVLRDGDVTQVSCQMLLQISGRRDLIKLG